MEDSVLLALALVTALSGLGLLYFVSSWVPEEEVAIGQITEDHIGRVVKTTGVVQDWKEYSQSYSIRIENGSLIDVYAQKASVEGGLELGSLVTVVGAVTEYQGGLEVVAESVFIEDFELGLVEICGLDAYLDKIVRVRGDVVDLRAVSSGVLLTVESGGCAIKIPVFFPVSLEGESIEVVGTVKLYKGELEVVPKSVDDINGKYSEDG